MKNMEWLRMYYFAHRGLHDEVHPENTMGALVNAVENGFDIECDIQMTLDKKIVVFHDKNLKRLCGVDLIVERCYYDEIKDYKIRQTNERIPLLSEVLDSVNKDTKMLIEFKPSSNHLEVVEVFLELMNNYKHVYAIHSFDPRIVRDFKNLAPEIIRGFIAENFRLREHGLHGKFCAWLWFNKAIKPDFINYGIKDIPRKKLDKLKKKGMLILSYTARTQEQLDYCRRRYDNAVFEHFIPNKKSV